MCEQLCPLFRRRDGQTYCRSHSLCAAFACTRFNLLPASTWRRIATLKTNFQQRARLTFKTLHLTCRLGLHCRIVTDTDRLKSVGHDACGTECRWHRCWRTMLQQGNRKRRCHKVSRWSGEFLDVCSSLHCLFLFET